MAEQTALGSAPKPAKPVNPGGLPRTESGALDSAALLEEISSRILGAGATAPAAPPKPPPVSRGTQIAVGIASGLTPDSPVLQEFHRQRAEAVDRQVQQQQIDEVRQQRHLANLEGLLARLQESASAAKSEEFERRRLELAEQAATREQQAFDLGLKDRETERQVVAGALKGDVQAFGDNSAAIVSEAESLKTSPNTRALGLQLKAQHDLVLAAIEQLNLQPELGESGEFLKSVQKRLTDLNDTLQASSGVRIQISQFEAERLDRQIAAAGKSVRALTPAQVSAFGDGFSGVELIREASRFFEEKGGPGGWIGSEWVPTRFRSGDRLAFEAKYQAAIAPIRKFFFGTAQTETELKNSLALIPELGSSDDVMRNGMAQIEAVIATKLANTIQQAGLAGFNVGPQIEQFEQQIGKAGPLGQALAVTRPGLPQGFIKHSTRADGSIVYQAPDGSLFVDDPMEDDDSDDLRAFSETGQPPTVEGFSSLNITEENLAALTAELSSALGAGAPFDMLIDRLMSQGVSAEDAAALIVRSMNTEFQP